MVKKVGRETDVLLHTKAITLIFYVELGHVVSAILRVRDLLARASSLSPRSI